MDDVIFWLQCREQRKIEHFRITYRKPDGEETYRHVTGKDKRDEVKQMLKDKGNTIISCKKLYPFSTNKNQHNFELIRNVCMNRIYDIDAGEPMTDEHELERLYAIKEKADKYWGLELPVAWLPWEELQEAKELCVGAIEHRANACIEAGRPDLVKYC